MACKSKCCKTGELIGSPILSKDEVDKLPSLEAVKKIDMDSGESYWVLGSADSNSCPFLGSDLKCKIEQAKPLDCLSYPIKAIYKNDEIVFILDKDCPAALELTEDFIKSAKEIAISSIKRFEKETYNHWLSNYVGWASKELKEDSL